MGYNKFRGVVHLLEVRKVMRMKMWVNMSRQAHLQKLHITDAEVIQILEQGCYMPPEKHQGNKKIQIKERAPMMI